MNLTEFLSLVRDTLDDPGSLKFTDALLARAADQHVRSMFREQAQVDDSYHNCHVNLSRANFRQTASAVWDHPMRSWADKVLVAWKRERASAEGFDHESPELVLGSDGQTLTETHSSVIPLANIHRDSPGWQLIGQSLFRLVKYTDAIDCTLQVAKLPAKLTRGTVDRATGDDKSFYLAKNNLVSPPYLGTQELEYGAYRNAIFEFASSADSGGGDVLTGTMRTAVHSQCDAFPNATTGLYDKYVRVWLDSPLPRALAAGDTYDQRLEIQDANSRYLILCVARAGFAKQASKQGLETIARELMEERARFIAHISPRAPQEPKFVREANVSDEGVRALGFDGDRSLGF